MMNLNNLEQIVDEVIASMMTAKKNPEQGRASTESSQTMKQFDTALASRMEHSMIRPDATPAMVKQFCSEAIQYGFRNVALAPCFVLMAAQLLKGTAVQVATAVGFPMGIGTLETKLCETREVIANGAVEIDLPLNIGMIKAGEWRTIKEELEAIMLAAKGKALVKVVVDLGALSEEERIKAALVAKMAGADFLKIAATTRTQGVNAEDMAFFRTVVGNEMGLKADGGIKDYQSALAVIKGGGTTIGASGSIKIVTGNV